VINEFQESYNDTSRKAFLHHQSWTIRIPYKLFLRNGMKEPNCSGYLIGL